MCAHLKIAQPRHLAWGFSTNVLHMKEQPTVLVEQHSSPTPLRSALYRRDLECMFCLSNKTSRSCPRARVWECVQFVFRSWIWTTVLYITAENIIHIIFGRLKKYGFFWHVIFVSIKLTIVVGVCSGVQVLVIGKVRHVLFLKHMSYTRQLTVCASHNQEHNTDEHLQTNS